MAKINMTPEKTKMPEQDPDIRNRNFLEVATGYTPQMAQEEAQRCLNCKHKPCVSDAGKCEHSLVIQAVAQGDIEKRMRLLQNQFRPLSAAEYALRKHNANCP